MNKPFKSITFCPTGITEDVVKGLQKKIIKLGGSFSRDLTSQVQVLIVGNRSSEKYRYVVAYRADIIFIDSKTVEKLYEMWLAGEDIDEGKGDISNRRNRILRMLREKYQLGPLIGYYIFIGRIKCEDTSVRKLQQLCDEGQAFRCLTTHFIKDTECIAKSVFITDCDGGARAIAAREQGVPILHPKWIVDCMRRGAQMNLDNYELDRCSKLPWGKIGSDVCKCWDELEHSADSDFWSRYEVNIKENEEERAMKLNSRAIDSGSKLWASTIERPFITGITQFKTLVFQQENEDLGLQQIPGLFNNYCFYLFGFSVNRYRILEKVISLHEGELYQYSERLATKRKVIYMCPSDLPAEQIPQDENWITEFYIERCLYYKKMLEVDPWCTPFYSRFLLKPSSLLLKNKKNLTVHITGFQGIELLHIRKLISHLEPMGVTYMDELNASTDILIVNLVELRSIPQDHTLRQNQYSSMFSQDYKRNQVFRNSMKRKIEFISHHSIPLVTPGFIMELFRRALHARREGCSETKIYLNDVNWCVVCPRGSKENYTIKLEIEKHTSKESSSHGSMNIDISETQKANLFITSADSKAVKPVEDPIISPPSIDTTVDSIRMSDRENSAHIPKRQKPSPIKQIGQPSNCGNTMTSEEKLGNFENFLVDSATEVQHQTKTNLRETEGDDDLIYTQITYGSINDRKNFPPQLQRRVTRKYLRNEI